jgi:hypothetical protein
LRCVAPSFQARSTRLRSPSPQYTNASLHLLPHLPFSLLLVFTPQLDFDASPTRIRAPACATHMLGCVPLPCRTIHTCCCFKVFCGFLVVFSVFSICVVCFAVVVVFLMFVYIYVILVAFCEL